MEDELVLIKIYAGSNERGPVFEELPAHKLGPTTYRLAASPGLALNLAKDDVIDLLQPNSPAKVLQRGGNFCIQIYEAPLEIDYRKLESDTRSELNGSLDGVNEGNLAFSIPAANGIDRINRFFDRLKNQLGVEWYYANIYKNFEDPSDETLLDWWID